MSPIRRLSFPYVTTAALVVAAVAILGPPSHEALALPPAGTDVIRAYGQVAIESRLGAETINLSGTVTVQRQDPHMDGAVEVADAEIIAMTLTGNSVIGPIQVTESASRVSSGEIRSLQPPPDQFPASAFFDVFSVVSVPANPSPTASFSNSTAIRTNAVANLTAWPPAQLKFTSVALQGVDQDGDAMIDEDTSDDDGDHAYDEDRPGVDPDTPGAGTECGTNPDCDAFEGEDPPLAQCTLALCDDDGDTLMDEDPECTPLFPTLPLGACVVSFSLTVYADSDKDGCLDVAEQQTAAGSQTSGGLRNPADYWDFLDVPTGTLLQRDRLVSIADIASIVARFGSADATPGTFDRNSDPTSMPLAPVSPSGSRANYHPAFDRGGTLPGQDLWDLLPANGSINTSDIAMTVAQFGHTCAAPPPGA